MKTTAHIFKALGDEVRLRILSLLVHGQELCVCDIMAVLRLPQSTVSRHLAYLRNAGLVDDRRQGVWMYYKISHEEIKHGAGVVALVAMMLADNERAVKDQSLLKKHLKNKSMQACS